jgi:hypothetical protein
MATEREPARAKQREPHNTRRKRGTRIPDVPIGDG